MREFLAHLFVPRSSNNHRAALLHHRVLLGCTILFFLLSVLLGSIKQNFPQVLGVSIDISVSQLLEFTNERRSKLGEPPLRLNEELANAASSKAKDMFAKDYWAHRSPDGKTPWFFIKQAGYDYIYAGENLARGFTTASDIVDAWMASETHRENVVSSNYTDIGFAVEKGALNGEETVLVVQMFGNKELSKTAQKPSRSLQQSNLHPQQGYVAGSTPKPLIDSAFLSRRTAATLTILFIAVFVFDMIIVERKNIARLVGHNLDHAFFFAAILLIVTVAIGRGLIL